MLTVGVGLQRAFWLGWVAGLIFTFFAENWIAHSISHYGGILSVLAYGIAFLFAAILALFPAIFAAAVAQIARSFRPWVLALARAMGLSARLRTQPAGPESVIVLDTIGELVRAYQLATVVFVGGSFGRRGGQNILEPAACGKPVLFGPRMENFADSVQVLVGRGGLQVRDPVALLRLMRDLLARPDEIRKLGELAREAVSSVRGASARDARLIAELLP